MTTSSYVLEHYCLKNKETNEKVIYRDIRMPDERGG